jgi:L-seryl-tRNA(Ser) seleniumtransferase
MKNAARPELFRELPSVDELLRIPDIAVLSASHGVAAVTDAARAVLARLRQEIASGLLDESALGLALRGVSSAIEKHLHQTLRHSLRPVINATGVILHTNLGRAPLAGAALEHIRETAGGYSNLEFELKAGVRGKRDVHVERLFRKLLEEGGASDEASAGLHPFNSPSPRSGSLRACPELVEAAGSGATVEAAVSTPSRVATIVVNNNAAAVLLALNTLAEGGEVIVSRGELVEIGDSFRIPDVMAKSGAILREVGTTNRTRAADYEKAINERTRLLLRVHRSNFEITGFTEQPSTAELVQLARKRGLPLMEDLGSGALVDLESFGVAGESSVLDSLRAGVDVVTYSGDKLLGGPQAGLISGRADLVARMRANSLFRALRVDKLTYAALEATLLAYVKRDHGAIPALRMMRLTEEEIGRRAEAVAAQVRSAEGSHPSTSLGQAFSRTERARNGAPSGLKIEVIDGESVIGGGAAPSAVLPTRLLALSCEGLSADDLAARLRSSDPPIIPRVEEGRVLLDLRTVFPEQDRKVIEEIQRIAG